MRWSHTIAGLIIGALVAGMEGFPFIGAIGGGLIGFLLGRVAEFDRRIAGLESVARQRLREQAEAPPESAAESPAEPVSALEPEPERGLEPPPDPASRFPAAAYAGAREPEAAATASGREDAPPESGKPLKSPWGWPPDASTRPSVFETLADRAKTWLTTGNIPVKVGVIVSFVGVSFLLKYAIDRRILVIPLEVRLLAVAAAGLALVITGWRLRERMRVYALSLQGGGLGILFLTIFAAFRLWAVLPAPLAFFLLVALTASTVALSVLQNSLSLAALGVVGGFLAPVLTSTGEGSHVTLFSYYLVLNGVILGVAWFRAWRELNLIGFVFTFVIGSYWGYQYYTPELWATTQPFLILHFLLYQVIAILYALRQTPRKADIIDGTLVFGTPVIAFALQYALVRDTEYGLAISAAAVAVFYALSATYLFRRRTSALPLLVESYMALAVAFATLAVPLALDARWTSATWSLEGAALVWIGARQGRLLAKLAGSALIVAGGFAFLDHGWRTGAGLPVLNGNVLGGILISISAFFASKKLHTMQQEGWERAHRVAALGLFAWATLWWLGTGWLEVIDRLDAANHLPVILLFLGASSVIAGWLPRIRPWDLLQGSVLVFLPLLAFIALQYPGMHRHFLLGLGWLAWPLAWTAQAHALRTLDDMEAPVAGPWHFISLLLLTLLLAFEAAWWTNRIASDAWAAAAASAVAGISALVVWRFRRRPAWPVPAHPLEYLGASLLLVVSQALFLGALCIAMPGDPGPWPYLPVLNPFDLAMLFAMLTAVVSLTVLKRDAGTTPVRAIETIFPPYRLVLAGSFLVLTTAALVRGVHYYSTVPWDFDALFGSVVVQTSLSIYWGLLGFAGMIWGARSGRRPVWLAGAGFMALVVIKLFLVDLGNTGTVARIISFIGIGALLLVVGYFAPVPPRRAKETPVDAEKDRNAT
jgi:uncharacterized membrane protein